MGHDVENANFAPDCPVGTSAVVWKMTISKGDPASHIESPGMNSTVASGVLDEAATSQAAFEAELPTNVKAWYDQRTTAQQDALYLSADAYRDAC